MRLLVCVKQIPDMDSRFKATSEGDWYDEADLAWRMNEYDEYAVEQAARLKEQLNDAPRVTVLSIGPSRVREVIKKALAMGCDRGVHVEDSGALLRDPWQIASIIVRYAQGQAFDLIFTGMQSQDRGSAQIGVTVAEQLGYACTTTVIGFDYTEGVVTARRELEGGVRGVTRLKTPALLTCQLGLNVPRYPTLPNIMRAKHKEIQVIPVADLLFEEPLAVTEMFYPSMKQGRGIVLEGDVANMADKLVSIMNKKSLVPQ